MNLTQMNEHEQWEAIKTWWKANAVMLISIVLLAVIISFGYRYWQQHQLQKQEQSSALFDQLLLVNLSLHSEPLTHELAARLEKDYTQTPYAGLAALLEAKMAVEKNDLGKAQEKLQWVISNGKSADLRQIARIRMARVLLALKQPAQALSSLEIIDDVAFLPAINQVRGDIFLVQGKKKDARSAYEAALKSLPPTLAITNYLQMQVNQL